MIFVIPLLLAFILIPFNAVFADNELKLLKDIEPNAEMTPEQGNLEVVKTLNNVGGCNEVYYVVKEQGYDLQGVVQFKDEKLIQRLPLKYMYIDEIINANYKDSIHQFIYVYQDLNQHYVYDLVREKWTKLNLSGREVNIHHGYKHYLGKSKHGDLFDLCGICCGEQIAPFQAPAFVTLDEESGNFLYADEWGASQEIDLLDHPLYFPRRYMTQSDKYPRRNLSYWIDYPQGNSVFDKRIRQYISQTIHRTIPYGLTDLELYVPYENTCPTEMLDYYSSRFFISDSIDAVHAEDELYSGYEFNFIRKWESDSYVTYLLYVHEDSPVNSWMNPSTWSRFITFDKRTGIELDDALLFVEDHDEKINSIVWTALKENLWQHMTANIDDDPNISMDDIKEDYESVLDYLGGDDYFNWRDMSSIALTPRGAFFDYQTKAREGTSFVIPYEMIRPYMTVHIEKGSKDVYLESIKKASLNAETIYQENFNRNYVPNEERLASIAESQGVGHGDYLLALSQLADVYHLEGKTKRAITIRQEYLNTVERLIGCNNYAWEANAQRYLKDLLIEKEYDTACIIGNKLSDTWPESTEEQLEYYEEENKCEQMLMTTDAFFMAGNYLKAETICHKAMLFAVNDEQVLRGITYLSRILYANNELDSCLIYANQAITKVPHYISETFHTYTAIQRQELWEKFQPWYCSFIPNIAYKTGMNDMLTASYNAMLFGKGLLLNTESSIRQAIINSGEEELINQYDSLSELKKELSEIRMRKIDPDEKAALTNEIVEKIRDTESVLIRKSKQYGDFSRIIDVKKAQLLSVLQDHEIAIEFCFIEGDYYAIFLKYGLPEPMMVKLCSEEQLLVDGDIYALIWEPLEAYLDDIHSIYFAPTGLLFNIGIEYASLPKDEVFINEKYNIFRLSSTRELVALRSDKYNTYKSKNSAVLYGGIDYNRIEQDIDSIETSLNYRSAFDLKDIERGSARILSYLPGTEEEVKIIGKTLRNSSPSYTVTILSGTNASETSFKSLSGKRDKTIHLATHGFYIAKDDAEKMSRHSIVKNTNINDRYIEDRELLRSGLMMAGVTAKTEGKIDDGVLTALEVASMDLSYTDLVVLSACETALGDISSEGVFGLQRGFKKAGAHALLMSLWKVDDTATQLLMTEFYKDLTKGQTKREALLNAQRFLRKYKNGIFANPKHWASFILLDGIN